MRHAPLIAALCSFAALAAAQGSLTSSASAEQSGSRAVSGGELQQIKDYSQGVGREVLKEELGVDLDALRFKIDPSTMSIVDLGSSSTKRRSVAPGGNLPQGPHSAVPSSKAAPEAVQRGLLFSVDQQGDLLRLGRDVKDIPFGLEVKGGLPVLTRLTELQTKIWVPFSWRDEIKAEALIPLKGLGLGLDPDKFKGAGLRSDYTNRLGVNQVDAGLGTQWDTRSLGELDLDYDYSQRFGQGLEETIHWLKLRKDF